MAGSRSSTPADASRVACDPVTQAVARALAGTVGRGARVAVALSGGRDSVALLAALAEVAGDAGVDPVAIHVHHGLSDHADRWLGSCETFAASLSVELFARRVRVDAAGHGVEAAAREARYAALSAAARESYATAVLLAHHQDDQAETLLLQLGRGAGVHGLAGMPGVRRDATGLLWLRPLLDVPRRDIDAFVQARRLSYVDDDSNASHRYRRNALRSQVVPALAKVLEGYPASFARAATHQAEAALLLDELAALDAGPAVEDGTLSRAGLAALAPHRARNLLRWFLRQRGLRAPSTARLAAMLEQLAQARTDSRVRLRHDGAELGVHRDRIVVHDSAPAGYEFAWRGEAMLQLPHGELHFLPAIGEGLATPRSAGDSVIVRPRCGGERLQLSDARPRRALKSWLQEAGLPVWERDALPLVFCDGTLAAVPGLGVDVAFRAAPGSAGLVLDWRSGRPPTKESVPAEGAPRST